MIRRNIRHGRPRRKFAAVVTPSSSPTAAVPVISAGVDSIHLVFTFDQPVVLVSQPPTVTPETDPTDSRNRATTPLWFDLNNPSAFCLSFTQTGATTIVVELQDDASSGDQMQINAAGVSYLRTHLGGFVQPGLYEVP